MGNARRFGSLRKLPSGRIQARYTGPDGRTHKALRDPNHPRRVRELNRELRAAQSLSRIVITAQAAKNQASLSDIRQAGGGLLRGPGTGTSDSILLWGSDGEFMQRKAAVDYYGLDFMCRLNALEVPRGSAGLDHDLARLFFSGPGSHGTEIRGVLSIDRDGRA